MPEQKNSPLSDAVVEQLEDAGRKVVSEKLGNKLNHVLESKLSGATHSPDGGEIFYVTVKTDGFIMNVGEPVETNLGPASIETVYTSKEPKTVRVSVGFDEDMLEEAKQKADEKSS